MSIKAETGFSLKDHLFNEQSVGRLADALKQAHPPLRRAAFMRESLEAFPQLELKARIDHLVTVVTRHLPSQYSHALGILAQALPPPLDPDLLDDDFGEFIWVVPGEFAARHGCTRQHLKRSLAFLQESTQRFSAENAIRPFLASFPDETLDFIRECAAHENYHVRRLATEGTRPLLPWCMRVNLPREPVLEVLDMLHADSTRYVTRSVANHLNDIAKSDPTLVIRQLRRWHQAGRQTPDELAWMTRHALRTLIREDNVDALALLGYPKKPQIRLESLEVSPEVKVGEALTVSVAMTSLRSQALLITMKVHFRKANGQLSPKVFKVKDIQLTKDEPLAFTKRLPLRPMTTRTLYPGAHQVEIVANGTTITSAPFLLVA